MVTSVFSLCQNIFGKKDNGIGFASMIIEGFQHVIQSIQALQERMDYRFDRIEHLMERHHYQTITMLFELSRQTNGLHNLIMHGQEIQTKQVHSIRYDISQVSSNLQSCSAMILNNINAFREEKLIGILREVEYYISNNITIKKVHKYLAKLRACFDKVAMNPNLTGMTLLSPSSSIDIQIKALQDALATNLYSVVNVFTGPTIVGHLEILKVLEIYTRQLIRIIPIPTEYNREFSARITAEIDKIKTVTFSNPFSTKDAEVLVTENWTHKKSEMHSKVNEWFSNKVAFVLDKIRKVIANDFLDNYYISVIFKYKNSYSEPERESFEYIKKYLDNKYYSNEHLFVDLEFDNDSLKYIRKVSQIDMLLARYDIYKLYEFTQRYQQYRDIGIIIKLKFCIGFDETIQITEYLYNVISDKEETISHKVIQQKYAELKDLKRCKPMSVLKDAIFGYCSTICEKDNVLFKFSYKQIDDFLVRGDMSLYSSILYSRSLVAQDEMVIPTKVEEFKAETAEFFKLHDDNYKEAVRQNELHTIAEQVLVKLKAKQTE
jgi:hypothetical protein